MFVKYSSLTNHYEGKFINGIVMNGLASGEWVAREKIHGANFSFLTCDGATVIPAKRSGEILPGERFYDCENVVAKYLESVRNLWQKLFVTGFYDVLNVQIFGELAGRGVQKDVDYGEKDFYVFDIKVNGEYLDDRLVSSLARECGLKMAPLLGYGSYEHLKELPLTFESVVLFSPSRTEVKGEETVHNINEAADDVENIAEGYVLKPVVTAYMTNGSRVAIKCKTSKFSEKKNKSTTAFNAPVSLSEADKLKLGEYVNYLTENRVKNVLSKIDASNLTAKDFGRVAGLTVQDALEEIERNEGDFVTKFENPAFAKKLFVSEAQSLIRPVWGLILNNEF
ncbi:RNA ligase [Pantoea phage Phynn]|nr:RNA ligase [Pantoea phage Phynn]